MSYWELFAFAQALRRDGCYLYARQFMGIVKQRRLLFHCDLNPPRKFIIGG